jgi:hypothetical protein
VQLEVYTAKNRDSNLSALFQKHMTFAQHVLL